MPIPWDIPVAYVVGYAPPMEKDTSAELPEGVTAHVGAAKRFDSLDAAKEAILAHPDDNCIGRIILHQGILANLERVDIPMVRVERDGKHIGWLRR